MQNLSRFILLSSAFMLVGCGNTSEMLGMGRHSPDEFAVVDRPPLSLPPDYDLRPPRPGVPRPQKVEVTDRASEVLYGSRLVGAEDSSNGEVELLKAAGADKADPSIRSKIDREAKEKISGSQKLVEELLFWRDPAAAATTVDAPAEAKRLKEAKENDEKLNAEPTPVIEKNRSGWLF